MCGGNEPLKDAGEYTSGNFSPSHASAPILFFSGYFLFFIHALCSSYGDGLHQIQQRAVEGSE